jgi:hypothetical protein
LYNPPNVATQPALLRRQPRRVAPLHQGRVRRSHLPRPALQFRQDYNVLFAEKDGARSSSQIIDAEKAYQEIVEAGGRVSDAMRAFGTFLGQSDMMAYPGVTAT